MSETVKLIIEIPKEQKRMVDMMLDIPPQVENDLISAIRHGTPLDDVKAEIKQNYQEIDTVSHNEYENAVEQGKEIAYENALSILDNIGKGDKE